MGVPSQATGKQGGKGWEVIKLLSREVASSGSESRLSLLMRKTVGASAAARGAVGKPLIAAVSGEARGSRW